MWTILSLVIDALKGNKVQIVLGVALIAAIGYGYYQSTQINDLEVQVTAYKQQLEAAKALDELNKQTAIQNEQTLKNAIDRQNEMFDKLAAQSDENNERVLTQLAKSQTSTAQQYARVSTAIEKIQTKSCEGMMEEMVNFPQTLSNTGITK